MHATVKTGMTLTRRPLLTWTARVTSLGVIGALALVLTGENGGGPAGWQEWLYLALFPVGFSIAYLAAWKWPRQGALAALACMVLSQVVIWRTFDLQAYLVWAVLCIPALLFLFSARIRRDR